MSLQRRCPYCARNPVAHTAGAHDAPDGCMSPNETTWRSTRRPKISRAVTRTCTWNSHASQTPSEILRTQTEQLWVFSTEHQPKTFNISMERFITLAAASTRFDSPSGAAWNHNARRPGTTSYSDEEVSTSATFEKWAGAPWANERQHRKSETSLERLQ